MLDLGKYADIVNRRLNELLPEKVAGTFVNGDIPALVNNAMRYSLTAGGKRLRPAMLMACADMLGGDASLALEFGCAVEMIHTYSLIHDDLPGMDNDTLRRGRPTNHVVFGVGQAILAGDGLLNLAFETMLQAAFSAEGDHKGYLRAIGEIAKGAGSRGMVGGQCLDLYCEHEGIVGQNELEYIHINKTARMFIHPLRAAAIISGASEDEIAALTEYGRAFGVLFQATDDILDVVGDSGSLGKSIGKDAEQGKLTCISVYGLEGTRALVEKERLCAIKSLEIFGEEANFFRRLVDDMAVRTY